MNSATLSTGLLLASLAAACPAQSAILRIDGEVYAQRSSQLMPPSVSQMWQFNITQLAPDGSPVKKGDIVVAFDGNELNRQLAETQGQLQEKQRELENLDLDLAERQRSATLATAEAQSQMEKARRKTEQPREIVAALQYDKLINDRRRTENALRFPPCARSWPRSNAARNAASPHRSSPSCKATSTGCNPRSPHWSCQRRAAAS